MKAKYKSYEIYSFGPFRRPISFTRDEKGDLLVDYGFTYGRPITEILTGFTNTPGYNSYLLEFMKYVTQADAALPKLESFEDIADKYVKAVKAGKLVKVMSPFNGYVFLRLSSFAHGYVIVSSTNQSPVDDNNPVPYYQYIDKIAFYQLKDFIVRGLKVERAGDQTQYKSQ